MSTQQSIFKAAWKIAKNSAVKFGGSSKLYFSESLKIAYTLVQTTFDTIDECFANIYMFHFSNGKKVIVSAGDMSGAIELVEFWGLAGLQVTFIQCREWGRGIYLK